MIRTTTLTGTCDEVMESIHAMRQAGIRQVAIQAIADPKETIEAFSKEIIRRIR
jgi:2-iminoacetate synthase ThiH